MLSIQGKYSVLRIYDANIQSLHICKKNVYTSNEIWHLKQNVPMNTAMRWPLFMVVIVIMFVIVITWFCSRWPVWWFYFFTDKGLYRAEWVDPKLRFLSGTDFSCMYMYGVASYWPGSVSIPFPFRVSVIKFKTNVNIRHIFPCGKFFCTQCLLTGKITMHLAK